MPPDTLPTAKGDNHTKTYINKFEIDFHRVDCGNVFALLSFHKRHDVFLQKCGQKLV